MWRNLKFHHMWFYFTLKMWRNLKFLHMWSNFTFLNMTNVEKSEISFIINDLRCFVGKSFCRDLRSIAWRKFKPKIVPVKKK